jgi:hypothetical protein
MIAITITSMHAFDGDLGWTLEMTNLMKVPILH